MATYSRLSRSTATTYAGKILEDLDRDLTCPLCKNPYTDRDPRVLTCFSQFQQGSGLRRDTRATYYYCCRECLEGYIAGKGNSFHFPDAGSNKTAVLPEGGVSKLPVPFFCEQPLILDRMKRLQFILERAFGLEEAICEVCTKNRKAEKFCLDCGECGEFICESCKGHFEEMKIFAKHRFVTLDDIKRAKSLGEIVSKQHADLASEAVATTKKADLMKKVSPLEKFNASFSQTVLKIENAKAELHRQEQSLPQIISDALDELKRALTEQLKNDAESKIWRKKENLSSQSRGLSTVCSLATNAADYTQKCAKYMTDSEFMSLHDKMKVKLEEAASNQEVKRQEPAEPTDVDMKICKTDNLKELCWITLGKDAKPAMINQPYKVKLEITPSTPNPPATVKCHLKASSGGPTKEYTATLNQDGETYNIEFTPTQRGHHEIYDATGDHDAAAVAGDDQDDAAAEDQNSDGENGDGEDDTAAGGDDEGGDEDNDDKTLGDPLAHVFVAVDPIDIRKKIDDRAIDEESPHDVAVMPSGGILVATKSSLVLYNKNKRMVKSCNSKNTFWGLAVDKSSAKIYATCKSEKSLKVVRYSFDLHLEIEESVGGFLSSNFSGITIIGEEVMVVDHNRNCIKIYTKELKFVREIASGFHGVADFGNRMKRRDLRLKMSSICDIAADKQGNLYVSNLSKSAIQVFDKTGKYCMSFREGGPWNLTTPHGVCICSQFNTEYVYVADAGNGQERKAVIKVFTTKGEYVTSFGEGDLKKPWGLCVDQDGFIYVCDIDSNQVVVF